VNRIELYYYIIYIYLLYLVSGRVYMTPLDPLANHNNELAHSIFRATMKKIYAKSNFILDFGARICYNRGMKEIEMPTDIQPPSQLTEVATLQSSFIKKPCKYCHVKFDPRGLPQHERTHERATRASARLNKKRAPARDHARVARNAKARRMYHVKQRAKRILINQRNHHEEVATLQLPDNARAVRLAMLYLIKKDTDNATN